MAKSNKKIYFWLKLDQNFFKNLAIKQALRLPGGKDMIIVYQMLMLESLATDGILYYEGTLPSIEKELSIRLDINEEDIQMTLSYFKQVGLIQVDDYNNMEMLQVPALMDQETDWARYKRERRKQEKLDNVQHVSNGCPIEIEIEKEIKLDKELDIELESEVEASAPANIKPLKIISDYYQQEIGILSPNQFEQLSDYLMYTKMEVEVIKSAITKAADNGKRSFGYINSILRNWRQNGITTMVQVEEEERAFIERKAKRGRTQQPVESNVPEWAKQEPVKREQTEEEKQKLAELQAQMMKQEGNDGSS